MEIIRGKQIRAQKVVIYGVEKIGKSTLASKFPAPLFIDVEGGTSHLDVARLPKPSSWEMMKSQLRQFDGDRRGFQTLVIDTADWAARLCIEHICAVGDDKGPKSGLEAFGWGKGYQYLAEEFGRLLNFLSELTETGVNVVMLAHAGIRRHEQPDEDGSYDRWELKMPRITAPLVKEWADMILFANFKTIVVATEDETRKGKGARRVLYTQHHACWDAGNRHDLPAEVDMTWEAIAHCFPTVGKAPAKPAPVVAPPADEIPGLSPAEKESDAAGCNNEDKAGNVQFNSPLYDLIKSSGVTVAEVEAAVIGEGIMPAGSKLDNYPDDLVKRIVSGWSIITQIINENKRK